MLGIEEPNSLIHKPNYAIILRADLTNIPSFDAVALLRSKMSGTHEKVVAVFPTGGSAAKEPRYLCCVENGLGLPAFLKGKAELVVTADKEGAGSGGDT